MSIRNLLGAIMAPLPVPKQPLKFVLEMTVFWLLLVPGILWALAKKFMPANQKSVKGQVVLITGAARGLGRELALRFSKLGAKIACVDVDETGNNETAQLIKDEGGVAVSYKCDVSNREQIKELHSKVRNDLGPVDILINNAGIVWGHLYVDPSKDQFIIDQINVNLMGQIWMNREILPSMLERNSGHIVAMSSLSSRAGVAGINTYTVSKWGTNGMMESLNNELKVFNSAVKTTTIMPFFVETNPKVTAKLNLRFPEIPTPVAGEVMIKGILEEQRIFSVPGYMTMMVELLRLLPDNLQKIFNDINYVEILPDDDSEHIIKKYKRVAT